MAIHPEQLSFAAGSSSLTPYGFRFLGSDSNHRLHQIRTTFPTLRRFLNSSSLIVNAYPASLGLENLAPTVNTFLHPPTFIRAIRLAVIELRPVIVTAQPLAGVDLFMNLIQAGFCLPEEMLWATGGYYFPLSLENYVRNLMAQNGCNIEFLQSYGVAEIGHTCFAGVDRFSNRHPRYIQVASEISIAQVGPDSKLHLTSQHGNSVLTDDTIRRRGEYLEIVNGQTRGNSRVIKKLETWDNESWSRRTGYLYANGNNCFVQTRAGTRPSSESEIEFFEFRKRFGGTFQTKPVWQIHND